LKENLAFIDTKEAQSSVAPSRIRLMMIRIKLKSFIIVQKKLSLVDGTNHLSFMMLPTGFLFPIL
jgi:hypothetical protein